MSKFETDGGQPTADYFRMVQRAQAEGSFYAKDFIDEPLPTTFGVLMEAEKILTLNIPNSGVSKRDNMNA